MIRFAHTYSSLTLPTIDLPLLTIGLTLLTGVFAACSSDQPSTAGDASGATADAKLEAGISDAEDALATVDANRRSPETAETSWQLPPPTFLGGKRPAQLYLPSTYDGSQALPVVLALPGYDNSSAELDEWLKLTQRVDGGGFALILAQGLTDTDGSPYWNATDTCCDYDGTGVDDVGYLVALLDELASKVHTDPKKVTVFGHSAGGFMAYRLACERAERVAAVVSLAGSGYVDAAACVPKLAVSVLQVHGLLDDVMPYAGDSEAPGALEMLERWAGYAGCALNSLQAAPITLAVVKGTDADQATVLHYAQGCQAGMAPELWRLPSAGHYPKFKPAFTDLALSWALQRSR